MDIYEKTFVLTSATELKQYLTTLLDTLDGSTITIATGCGKEYDDTYIYLDRPLIIVFDNSNIFKIDYRKHSVFNATYTSIVDLDLDDTGIGNTTSLINPSYFEDASLVQFKVSSNNNDTFDGVQLKLSNNLVVDMSIQEVENCCAIKFIQE